MAKTLAVFALLLAVAAAVAAQDLVQLCATGPETDAKLAALERWVEAKNRERGENRIRAAAETTAKLVNGMFVVEATPANSPFKKSFDLQNSSMYFSRGETGIFTVAKQPLHYEPAAANPTHRFRKDTSKEGWDSFSYQLKNFEFPFFDRRVSQVHISAFNAIFLEAPPRRTFYQFGPLEAMTQPTPVIAPLLLTEANPAAIVSPELYISDSVDAVTFTWRTPAGGYFRHDVQATLFASGDIRFSYGALNHLSWGAVVVSSGAEDQRLTPAVLATQMDATGDVDARTEAELAPMLDIESAEINRLGSSNLLQVKINLKAPIDRSLIHSDSPLQYYVDFSDQPARFTQYLLLTVRADEDDSYFISGWGSSRRSPAARIDGKTITLNLLQEHLALPTPQRQAYVGTSHLVVDFFTDEMVTSLEIGAPGTRIESDLSAAGDAMVADGPVIESFTVPVFNPRAVLSQLRGQFNLKDDEIDAIAMYQTYMTDIIFYAGAYSTVGNPGADGVGVRNNYGKRFAKTPSLLHMHAFDYGWNATDRGSSSVSLHELGHRWLYHLRIREDGNTTRSLNPVSGHPAEFVHTAAPFNVYSTEDASTMGGAWWFDKGNGTFISSSQVGYYSYSWTDLYLMGLAAPEEVQPWFYISGAQPALRNEYTPRPGTEVSGARRDVVIQQVIDALGPRNPSHHQAPREFTVYFVLVTEAGAAPTPAQLMAIENHRRLFEESFKLATGGRAEVRTHFRVTGGSRLRGVRR